MRNLIFLSFFAFLLLSCVDQTVDDASANYEYLLIDHVEKNGYQTASLGEGKYEFTCRNCSKDFKGLISDFATQHSLSMTTGTDKSGNGRNERTAGLSGCKYSSSEYLDYVGWIHYFNCVDSGGNYRMEILLM